MERYPEKIGIFSSHRFIKNEIMNYSEHTDTTINVLDVGCATGELAHRIPNKGKFLFYGIEPFEFDAKIAISKGYTVWHEGVETALQKLDSSFQVIVAADVLEHLANPKKIFDELIKKMSPGGLLIISVPNIANFIIRINLLFGKFNYTDRGIMDRTHLRFFTRKTFKELIQNKDVEIKKLRSTPIPLEIIFPWLSRSKFGEMLQILIYVPSHLLPGLFGYQHLCVITKLQSE